ncbi:mediator of RNA polymerase II transcription subunit 16-like [Ruditapes philippinarum]|uniref:mediator of RNA polymerase II transcription subunit 16-like n=1 Tax=Ruditapes philippinarum TaxID=129788 RepID=UPI00295AEE23|nr:mediator of RNA polymerase II transcription subunit 16-like [Ruditapes philippinarum]
MELVYSIDVFQKPYEKDWVSEERNCLNLSCRNILALLKQSEIPDSSHFDRQYEVVVLDIDKPWEPHCVTSVSKQLLHIVWDTTGSKLLLIDVDGECQVWAMKDHLLNEWHCIGSVNNAGEEVLAVMWFHNGLQIIFDPDKRDKTQYIEKFVRNMRFTPSLTQFGGCFLEGWVVVSSSGLVTVGVHQSDGSIVTSSESLSRNHMRLTAADIANTGNGDIMVATSDGQLSSAIQCFLVSVKLSGRNIAISCVNSASLYTKTQTEYGSSENNTRITKVMFMNNESSDTLLICCGSSSYSSLEVWQLLEQMLPQHKMFSLNTAPYSSIKTHKWMHKATIPHPSQITSIAGPKLPMSRNVVETSGFLPYIAMTYKDGTLQLIHRYTFQPISTSNLDSICQPAQSFSPQHSNKKIHMTHQLSALTQTGSGCGIFGLHDGRVYLFSTYNGSRDSTMQLSPSSIVLLLEYAMVTGQDWWDVFLAVRQGMIMSICQTLTDNFGKQVHTMQDYVFIRLLSMKMGLYSCYSAGHQKAVDYHTQLVLYSIGNYIKSILKPRNITSQDKGPAEKVGILCSKHNDGDIDMVLRSLDSEEFHVDVKKKDKADVTLLSMQPLIQWVSDFSLQLLSAAPMFQSFSSFTGSSLLTDSTVLHQLRELLVIFKMWGQIYPTCLPSFTTTSINLDILKHLYKLLTRAWNCCKEGRSIEFDDTLLDECSVLPSKVFIPGLSQSFRMDNMGFTVFTQTLPLEFQFNEEPDYLYQKKITKTHKSIVDQTSHTDQHHDIVRQIHLGTKVSGETRKCTRCGCLSLLKTVGKSQTMISWEQRWTRNCLCMGHWKLVAQ